MGSIDAMERSGIVESNEKPAADITRPECLEESDEKFDAEIKAVFLQDDVKINEEAAENEDSNDRPPAPTPAEEIKNTEYEADLMICSMTKCGRLPETPQ